MKRKAPGVVDREQAILERQVKHVTRLIGDLLDVSRITSGKIKLSKEAVDLADMVDRALESTAPLLEEHQHNVVVDVPPGLTLKGDPERLLQVATNLISNAAKYTPHGGRIEIVGHREGDSVMLRVTDDGDGLDPDILPNIFDLFVQGAQAADRAKGGLGLGLSIVRSVVELHGGRVSADSEGPGRGSTFRVELPATDGEERAMPAPEATSVVSTHGVKLLIVDDNEDALDLLADALRLAGHDCFTASDPMQALERAAATQPAIALVDIGLPVMDGYELAGRLREIPGLRAVKLVALTGYGQKADKERARAAGFDEHLVKPVAIEQLEAVIAKLV
jgi:CheY-like chemotaxis protein/two-component sensor histidine kinase